MNFISSLVINPFLQALYIASLDGLFLFTGILGPFGLIFLCFRSYLKPKSENNSFLEKR
jgi:hypothetical protein